MNTANSGQTLGQERTISEKDLNAKTRAVLQELQTGKKADLVKAIDNAEHNGTKVIGARVASGAKATAMYDLELVKNGTIHTAMVNAHDEQGS
jgi:phosphoheptose isomerase